jgi:putative hydrolase of the HAD superfamily
MKSSEIKVLFLDIGGVLLTNGWDRSSRAKAIAKFDLKSDEFNDRHALAFHTYEEGKMTLREYLAQTVFYETRQFSEKDFIAFMFQQSVAFPDTIAFFEAIKKQYRLKVIAVNNEGRELHEFRVKEFKLNELFDAYVCSAFVHFRKPDLDIFRLALDISQTAPKNCIYVDDRLMFVEIAQSLGMNAVHYQGLDTAIGKLKALGLSLE